MSCYPIYAIKKFIFYIIIGVLSSTFPFGSYGVTTGGIAIFIAALNSAALQMVYLREIENNVRPIDQVFSAQYWKTLIMLCSMPFFLGLISAVIAPLKNIKILSTLSPYLLFITMLAFIILTLKTAAKVNQQKTEHFLEPIVAQKINYIGYWWRKFWFYLFLGICSSLIIFIIGALIGLPSILIAAIIVSIVETLELRAIQNAKILGHQVWNVYSISAIIIIAIFSMVYIAIMIKTV